MTCMWIRVAATWASGRRGRGRGWDTNNSYGFISLNGSMGTSANFYSGPADTNLYINRPTGKDIIFAENNGTGQMTILTGGNVGIGTTSPLSGLHVAGTDKGTTNIYTGGNLNVTATDSMAADKGGSINLGGLVNASSITGYGSIKGAKSNSTSDNYDGYLSFYTTKQTIGSREWMRITADGNVGIGTNVPDSIKLDVEGDIEIGTGTTGCVRDADNTTLVGSCVSDERLKKNITALPDGTLDKLMLLRPVTFEWRNDEYPWLNGQVETNYGLIAQEVEAIFPDMINTDEMGYKRVSYDIGLRSEE